MLLSKEQYEVHTKCRVSAVRIATRYGLDGPRIDSRWGARFSAPVKTGPGSSPASCTMGTGSFPELKRPGRGVDHLLTSSGKAKERVGLYLYSAYGPLWSVLGWPLPLPFTMYTETTVPRIYDFNFMKPTDEGRDKYVPVSAMKVCRWRVGGAPVIHSLGTRTSWVVDVTLRPFYLSGRNHHWMGGLAPPHWPGFESEPSNSLTASPPSNETSRGRLKLPKPRSLCRSVAVHIFCDILKRTAS